MPTAPTPSSLSLTDLRLAHTGLRLLIGVNIFMHGAVRLPKLSSFAEGMAQGFAGTWMPPAMALPFAYAIPIIEVVLGAMLLLGFRLRDALVGSLLLMTMLTAGVGLQEKWSVAGSQLVYGAVFAALLATRHWSAWTLDHRPAQRRDAP